MQELIKITEQNGKQAVSARELHSFLGSKKDFSSWIKDRIKKYGLIENEDFILLTNLGEQTKRGGHNKIEYILTIDCAKELSMVEGNEKGKQARRYFIECDKQLKQIESTGGHLLKNMQERLTRLETQMNMPGENEFTVFGYSNLIRKKLYGSEAVSIGKKAAKRCREEKIELSRIYDPRYGMVNTYPEFILKEVFEEFFLNPRF